MAKRKKDNTIYWILGILAFLIILIYGGNHDWFKSSLAISQPTQITQEPSKSQPVLNSCNALCSQEGFSTSKNSINDDGADCDAGSVFYKYGYQNQAPLLKCCCWNDEPQSICTDSDGESRDTPGHVTYDGLGYYDECLVGSAVKEYICENGAVSSKNLACDYGEICEQTRSGGYCVSSSPTWSPGDTVWSGSGSQSVIGTSPITSSIDLTEYGLEPNGNCRLGVQFSSSWYYANDKCVGILGSQGARWDIYDSHGLEYTRLDPSPIGLGVDLHPESHIWDWDGQTDWVASMTPAPLPLPECSITYEWEARIYIYDC